MGSGFDLGLENAQQRLIQRRNQEEQQRVQQQNTVGAQLLDAINNASNIKPQTKDENGNIIHNPEYDNAQQAKQQLLQQYTTLMSPAQHASFADHLHGLIFGHADHRPQQPALSPNSSPNEPSAPAQGQAPAPSSASPAPLHPMAPAPPDHPIHAISKGIRELGNHLSAFAHPLPLQQQPDPALMAKYYRDPAEVQFERNKEIWGVRGQNALELQNLKNEYLKTQLQARPPRLLSQTTIPDLLEQMKVDPTMAIYAPDGHEVSPAQLAEMPAGTIAREFRAGSQIFYALGDQNSKTLNVGGQIYDIPAVGQINIAGPKQNSTVVGQATSTLPHASSTTDPFGLTTTSKRQTVVPPVSSAAPPPPGAPPVEPTLKTRPGAEVNPGARPPGTVPGGAAVKTKPVSINAPLPPLDENGHIPAGVGNDLVRQAANGILDGRDPKEFGNPKVQTAALALVDKFVPGYSRGAFTPKEKVQFGVAMHFLNQLKDSDSLSVLDNVISREKIARAMKAPEHMGLADRIAAYSLTPKEAEFVRFFNQARGTVAGLSQITRSGRATNSQVNTIAQELPNVFQSSSSDDARKRVDQLLKEADIALHTNPRDVGKQPVSKSVPKSPGGQTLADRLNEALGK